MPAPPPPPRRDFPAGEAPRRAPGQDAPARGAPLFIDSGQKGLGGANTLSPFPLAPTLGIPLPEAFDKWRQEGYLSPPGDQARCGACYVFAAVGQLADRLSIATGRRFRDPLSTQFVLSCLQAPYEYGCGGTLDVPPVYTALLAGGRLGGTYRQHVFPYSGQQWNPEPDPDPASPCRYDPGAPECQADAAERPALAGKAMALPPHCYPPPPRSGMVCTGTLPCDVAYIRRWYPDEPKFSFGGVAHLSENTNAARLFPRDPEARHYRLSVPVSMTPAQLRDNTRRIKEAVYLYGPVTAVMPVYEDFNRKFREGTSPWGDRNYVYSVDDRPDNAITGEHHVLIVGWGRDHWIVKNSWGVWWNYDGYFNARAGDPLLLLESNCHSGFPVNPETGAQVTAFDHSGSGFPVGPETGAPAAAFGRGGSDFLAPGGRPPAWAVAVFVLVFVLILLVAATPLLLPGPGRPGRAPDTQ